MLDFIHSFIEEFLIYVKYYICDYYTYTCEVSYIFEGYKKINTEN